VEIVGNMPEDAASSPGYRAHQAMRIGHGRQPMQSNPLRAALERGELMFGLAL
jgi:hypothetical protein